jgi:hypothetical protein
MKKKRAILLFGSLSGLMKNGGQLLNKINSLSPKRWAQHAIF